jgi:taurine dioxygenase
MPRALRDRIEDLKAVYTLDLRLETMRFGRPPGIRALREAPEVAQLAEMAKQQPRAIHPLVWQRATGEKVLHVGFLHCIGLLGHEDPEGDALLQAVCQYVIDFPAPYYHRWQPDQMLVWDNWRMLHCVTGADPAHPRQMHRTTIKGDYGLGRFEDEPASATSADVMF